MTAFCRMEKWGLKARQKLESEKSEKTQVYAQKLRLKNAVQEFHLRTHCIPCEDILHQRMLQGVCKRTKIYFLYSRKVGYYFSGVALCKFPVCNLWGNRSSLEGIQCEDYSHRRNGPNYYYLVLSVYQLMFLLSNNPFNWETLRTPFLYLFSSIFGESPCENNECHQDLKVVGNEK